MRFFATKLNDPTIIAYTNAVALLRNRPDPAVYELRVDPSDITRRGECWAECQNWCIDRVYDIDLVACPMLDYGLKREKLFECDNNALADIYRDVAAYICDYRRGLLDPEIKFILWQLGTNAKNFDYENNVNRLSLLFQFLVFDEKTFNNYNHVLMQLMRKHNPRVGALPAVICPSPCN